MGPPSTCPPKMSPRIASGCSLAAFAPSEASVARCKRKIRSVHAFGRRGAPIRSVGLDERCATPIALLRMLLARRYADIVQPPGRTIGEMAYIGVCVDRPARPPEQSAGLTTQLRECLLARR